jgi:hypothetical protein
MRAGLIVSVASVLVTVAYVRAATSRLRPVPLPVRVRDPHRSPGP